jgi:hypothetical protein
MNAIEAAKIAERCQRNWDYSQPIPQEHIDMIIGAATTMPTKQNRKYYRLIVSTDINFNKELYKVSIDLTNPHFNNSIHRNTQVLAPLVLAFVSPGEDTDNPFNDCNARNFFTSIGIASGVAAHTAASLGYRTGYCACIEEVSYKNLLEEKLNINFVEFDTGLILGIGKPNLNYDRQDIVVDNIHHYSLDDSCDKDIEVIVI